MLISLHRNLAMRTQDQTSQVFRNPIGVACVLLHEIANVG